MNYINYYNNLYGTHYFCNQTPITYNCTDEITCEAIFDNSGLYKSIDECLDNCICKSEYNCINGTCIKSECGTKGSFSTLDECKANCCDKGCGWISIYDTHLTNSYAKGNYCNNNCGYGYTQYYSDSGSYENGVGPWDVSCIKSCLSISKAETIENKYYSFIQYFNQVAFPSEKSCDTHCKGTVTDSPIGSDKRWYIEFPQKGDSNFKIINIEQNIIQDKNCFYQLRICKGCDPCTVYDLLSTPGNNGIIYEGNANDPYKIFMEYKGTI